MIKLEISLKSNKDKSVSVNIHPPTEKSMKTATDEEKNASIVIYNEVCKMLKDLNNKED